MSTPDERRSDKGHSAVRQPHEPVPALCHTSGPGKRPADRSKPVVVVLNDRWRVINDGLQWVLQKRKGRPTPKSTGWRGRSYLRTRASLLDSVQRLCGTVGPQALSLLARLAEEHPSATGGSS